MSCLRFVYGFTFTWPQDKFQLFPRIIIDTFEATLCAAGTEESEAVEVLKAAGPGKKKQGGKGTRGAAPKAKHTQTRGKAVPDGAVKEEEV